MNDPKGKGEGIPEEMQEEENEVPSVRAQGQLDDVPPTPPEEQPEEEEEEEEDEDEEEVPLSESEKAELLRRPLVKELIRLDAELQADLRALGVAAEKGKFSTIEDDDLCPSYEVAIAAAYAKFRVAAAKAADIRPEDLLAAYYEQTNAIKVAARMEEMMSNVVPVPQERPTKLTKGADHFIDTA